MNYEHGCLQNFLSIFISSLTASIVKNNNILAGIYLFISKKTSYTKLERLSITNLGLDENIGKVFIK